MQVRLMSTLELLLILLTVLIVFSLGFALLLYLQRSYLRSLAIQQENSLASLSHLTKLLASRDPMTFQALAATTPSSTSDLYPTDYVPMDDESIARRLPDLTSEEISYGEDIEREALDEFFR